MVRVHARYRGKPRSQNTATLLFAGTVFVLLFFGAFHNTVPYRTTVPIDPVTRLHENLDKVSNDPVEFWVRQYLRFHDENRYNAKRGAVFLPVPAGLGDNVKGMLNLWGYAVLTGRVLLLDISEPCPLSKVIGEEAKRFIFQHGVDNNIGSWVGSDVYLSPNKPLARNVSVLLRSPTPVVSLKISVSTNPVAAARSLGYHGEVPPFNLEVRRAITQLLLQPSATVVRRVSSLQSKFGLCNVHAECGDGQSEYIAIHARLGGVGESHFKRFKGLKRKYGQIADCFARNITGFAMDRNEPLKIYVATDVPKFRGLFAKAMSKHMPNSMVYNMNAEVAHFARSSNVNAQEDLQVENLLVAGAKHIFAFRSGFSTVAHWRGNSRRFTTMRHRRCGVRGF